MKNRVFLLSFLAFTLFSCVVSEEAASFNKDEITITIVDNPFVSAKQSVYKAKRGEDLVVNLTFSEGHAYSSCSYEGAAFLSNELGKGILTLPNVHAPSRIYIDTISSEATIIYHLNGGSFLSKEKGNFFYQECSFESHLRPNLLKGTDSIYREGYSLIGWNSSSDGSGTHYGLGSRITIGKGITTELYAEWAKEADCNDFTWQVNEKDVFLSSYKGSLNLNELVVPSSFKGLPVTRICFGAIKEVNARRLILPYSVAFIESSAFLNCNFGEVYLFDSIIKMSDDSFSGFVVENVHINAYFDPGYLKESDNGCFADNMDRLILSENLPKMIFYGGCSMGYGLESEIFKTEYGDEYTYLNMGVIGGTNALFQFDCMLPYLKEDDIFIHAPEEASPYQLMADQKAESRIFMCVEGNYDLLSLVDCSKIEGFFSKFAGFNLGKLTENRHQGGLYTDTTFHQNEYGDFNFERVNTTGDIGFSDGEYTYNLDLVSDESITNLVSQYDRIKEKGASVYFSYAPLNYSNLKEEEVNQSIWEEFASAIEGRLQKYGYQVISKVSSYLFMGRYFYDTDYHLTNEGAKIRSKKLLSDLKIAIEENK